MLQRPCNLDRARRRHDIELITQVECSEMRNMLQHATLQIAVDAERLADSIPPEIELQWRCGTFCSAPAIVSAPAEPMCIVTKLNVLRSDGNTAALSPMLQSRRPCEIKK